MHSKRKAIPSLVFLTLMSLACRAVDTGPDSLSAAQGSLRVYVDLDLGWRFSSGESQMAMQPSFNDSTWRTVNLPHDWSIEGPFGAQFGSGNGFAPGGIAWYRRHFRMNAADSGKIVTLELDGVYDNAEVWLNGALVGGRPNGFESFTCDLTHALRFGDADNVISVRVDHSRSADSRWYTGSGIYRNVRLCIANPLHLEHWGTVVTSPEATADAASIHIETAVQNDSNEPKSFVLESDLIDADGNIGSKITTKGSIDAGAQQTVKQATELRAPKLWSTGSPTLYTLRSRLAASGEKDETFTTFGIRTLKFDPLRGFSLNGISTKLMGVCVHQDGGSVGVAIPTRVWERRLIALKALGVNAIRTSHNPPAPEFLDLCDRLGFLVMDEAFDEFTPGKNKWVVGWNQGVPSRFGYSEQFAEWSVRDIQDMVRRDRNHPCVVMWSIGNEIDYPNDPFTDPALGKDFRPGNPAGSAMVKWGRPLVAAAKELDGSRPVTAALASVAMSNAVGFAQILDITGYNYQESRYAADQGQFPGRFIYGSENSHTYAAWVAVRDNPSISGQFLWTGIDYLGEARAWPLRANPDGLLDLCGFVKPLGRFRQSLWAQQPTVYLCAQTADKAQEFAGDTNQPVGKETWNWPDNTSLTVSCYSNCPEVTLYLNGETVGTKRLVDADKGVLSWNLPFSKGVLKALGKREGRVVCEFTLQTAGTPSRIELRPDVTQLVADGKDISQIEFDVVDGQGVRISDAETEVNFELSGPSRILGIGNGDVSNGEQVNAPTHRVFQGRGLIIVQSTHDRGPITLKASADGLQSDTATLVSR
jgi:beta-galactosidase